MTEHEEKKGKLFCPYCDEEMKVSAFSCCSACGITIFYCPVCRKPVDREEDVCPHCGAEIKGKKA